MEQGYALGMIETLGLPGLIAAADAAAKAAHVKVVTYEGADAGIVTVYIIGDVSSVQAAVSAGESEARRIGQLLHSHVIPRPDQSVPKMIQKMMNKEPEIPQEQQDLEQKPIAELRRLARTFTNFPLPSQEISAAKKEDLIQMIKKLQEAEGSDQEA